MTDTTKLDIELEVHSAGEELVDTLTKKFAKLEAQIRSINGLAKTVAKSISSPTGKDSAGSTSSPRPDREAAAIARSIRSEARERERALRARFSFQGRMTRQREREESDVIAGIEREARARESALRKQFAFVERMARQRSREEAQAEREIRRDAAETARTRDRDARRSAQEQRRQDRQTASEALAQSRRETASQRRSERERDQGRDAVVRGAGQVRSGAGRAVAVGGASAAVLSYASKRALDSLTRSGVDIDAAMNSNARMESGVSAAEANKRATDIRTKSMPIARSLGIKTAEYLKARSEALQAGVDGEIVDAVTEFGSKYARINDLKANDVMESSGYGLTAMNAYGKVTPEVAKNFFNKMQYLAANTAASRQNLASFSKRGLSAGASLGMSVDDSLAFGGAATASGADGEMAARMLASQGTRLAELKTKAADIARKSHRSVKDREFLSLPRLFGFNNYKELSASVSADAAGTLEKIYAGIGEIADPVKRMQASELIFGKEFGPITAAMSKGGMYGKMRTAVRSKDANNAIDTGMNVRSGSFDFIMSQISATVQDLKDSLGLVLKPLWSDIRDFVMRAPKAFKSFETAFRSGLRGFLQGLGGDGTMAGLLRSWFGDPASFTVNARAIGDFARGFGQGLREVANAILSVIRVFAGSNASVEQLGQVTAKIIGFCAACLVAAPAIAVLGGLATAISGLATIALGSWRILKAAGLVGATGVGAAPKVPVGPGVGAAGGLFGKLMGWLTVGTFSTTAGLNKADQDNLVLRLGKFAEDQEKAKNGDKAEPRVWQDPPSKTDKLKDAIDQNTKALREQQDKAARGLIKKTSTEGTITYKDWMENNRTLGWSEASRQNRENNGSTSNGGEINRGIRGHVGRLRAGVAGAPTENFTGSNADVLKQAATSLGIPAKDLATVISYETAGKFSPGIRGGKGGNYQGLIQFGPAERAKYGVTGNESFAEQMPKVVQFLKDRGLKPGMGLNQLYATINGGNPYVSQNASDGNGTIASHVAKMQAQHGARAESFLNSGSNGAGLAGTIGAPSASVEAAKSLVGMGSSQAAAALGAKMTPGVWCADFVNGALAKANVKGVNSSVANSFLGWGQRVLDGVKPGDVVVTHSGGGVGQPGGHVGLATGVTQMKNGRLQYQTVSGNHGNKVGMGWEYADSTQVRRALESVAPPDLTKTARDASEASKTASNRMRDIGEGIRTWGWRKLGETPSLSSSTGAERAPLGETAPLNRSLTQSTGGPSNGANGSAGGGAPIAIHINGQNHSPDELANKVQRRLQDSMNRRTHDYDGFA